MQIVVLADEDQKTALLTKQKNENVAIDYVNDYAELLQCTNANAFFILQDELDTKQIRLIKKPVFIHSVITTLGELNSPGNVSRLNAWPTFLQRDVWEVATTNEAIVKATFEEIGWKYCLTPDEPGLIAARIIAMIINEGYFTYQEEISTKEDIDTAMKLGTNYPFGPFEWAQKIGLGNIYNLLLTMHKTNERYQVAGAIKEELNNI